MIDNINEIEEKFYFVPNKNGGLYRCKKCDKPCMSEETWLNCREEFMVTRIRCHLGCGSRWKLRIMVVTENEAVSCFIKDSLLASCN